jgi:prophage regulatory protein
METIVSDELRILRLPEVLRRTGLSRSQLYELVAKQDFPRAVPLSIRTRGYLASDIDGWISDRVLRSRADSTAPL